MKRISIVSIALIASLSLGACGSSNEESSAKPTKSKNTSAFAASLNAVEDAKSYKFSATVKIDGKIGGEQTNGEITMAGASSADGKTSSVVVDLGSLLAGSMGVGGIGNLGGLGANLDLEIEQRVIDGVAYTKNLDFLGTGNETWTKQNLSELLTAQEAQNPNQYLQFLEAASGKVEKLGIEEIGGVKATHYRSVITQEQMKKYFDSDAFKEYYEDQGVKKEDFDSFKSGYIEGLSNAPVDLWIDKDNLPVRMTIAASINAPGISGVPDGKSSSKVDSVFTIEFSDWGTELDIEAPPANQVVTKEEFEKQTRDQLLQNIGR